MPKYRVKPGFEHMGLGPGSVVEHTEVEAGPFLDKLELVTEEAPVKEGVRIPPGNPDDSFPAKKGGSDMPKDPTIQAHGGGFEPSQATVEQVKEWIATDPGRLQAAAVLQSERDGKNRKTVIEALEAYIEENANVN